MDNTIGLLVIPGLGCFFDSLEKLSGLLVLLVDLQKVNPTTKILESNTFYRTCKKLVPN
jgi:hypothetical protein